MIPAQLGRYRIIERLAAGGMGEVFLARQEGPAGFARPAVVKRILAHLAAEPGFVEMFLAEARLAAVLSHPNVVQIFELGQADGSWFIAMEYIHGRSVRALGQRAAQKGERVNPVQAARVLAQALEGLHYAHTATAEDGQPLKIVHRDVSPDNLFVGFNGVVKVLDFGIAKAANAIATTRTGELKGKFAYMAPEQVLARPLDARTDVYSAGVVLYELLAGERPFPELSDAALTYHIACVPPPPLGPKAPQAPEELCALVLKALEKDPALRWQSAEEFAHALEAFVHSVGENPHNAATGAYLKVMFAEASTEELALVAPPPDGVTEPGSLPPTRAANSAPLDPWGLAAPTGEATFEPPTGSGSFGMTQAPAPAATIASPDAPVAPLAPAPRSRPPADFEPPVSEPQAPALELARPAEDAGLSAAPAVPATVPARGRGGLLAVVALSCLIGLGWVGLRVRRVLADRPIQVASVLITSEPPGATLKIGEEIVGKTPWAGSNIWNGEVDYELSLPGRKTRRGTFLGGRNVELSATLPKK